MKQILLVLHILVGLNLYSQTVTERFVDTELKEVFGILESKYELTLAYDPDLVAGIKITEDLNGLSPEDALRKILSHTQLSFSKVRKDYFTIVPSSKLWSFKTKVLDNEGNGIPYAKVRVVGTYKGVYADENGNVEFSYRSDQPPEVEFSSIGYKNNTMQLMEIKPEKPVQLELDIQEFEEVLVEYLTEGINISDDISSITILPEKLGAVPGSTEPDVLQLVQNVPGINSASSTVSEIQIRGGTSDQNHLIWDGIPIYHPGHFHGMISTINPNIIHQANLHRGVYDPYYGGKASGLIELTSIDYVPDGFEAGAGLNLIQGDAYVKTKLTNKLGLLVSGRRSYMDFWSSPTYKQYANRVYQETEIENTGVISEEPEFGGEEVILTEITNRFVYYDINGKLIYKIGKNDLLTVSGLYTQNSLDYSTFQVNENELEENFIFSQNRGIGLNYQRLWNQKWKTQFSGSYAGYTYSLLNQLVLIEESDTTIESVDKSNTVNHFEVKLNNEYRFKKYHKLSFGAQLFWNEVGYSFNSNVDEDTINESGYVSGYVSAVNLNHQFRKGRWLTKVGFRGSFYSTTNEFFPEPRVYIQYSITDWLTTKAAFGMQNQFISQVDVFEGAGLGLANRLWIMADNDDAQVIKSNIINLGIAVNYSGWQIGIDVYRKSLTDIVNFSSDPMLSSGLTRGNAVSQGIDFLVKKRWKNFRSWIAYTLGTVDYEFSELSATSFKAPFNQTHRLNWTNTLSWRQFEFSSSFKIASGQPYTPISDVVEIEPPNPDEDFEGEYEIIYGATNSKTLPLFHQLDLSVFYRFPKNPEKKWKGTIGLSCFNIYNQQNLLSRTYEIDFEEDEFENPVIETYALDKYYLGITPNALIRFEF